ncbi:MAG: DNA recombination protein RmuC [Bacteroidia bacterium]
MEIIFLIVGIAVGFAIGWFAKKQPQINNTEELNQIQQNLKQIEIELGSAQKENTLLNELIKTTRIENQTLRDENTKLNIDIAKAQTNAHALLQRVEEQKAEMLQLKEQMNKDFENLANKIFEEKSEKFANQNKNSLDQILSPLKDRIKDFEDKVQKHYEEETREKASLKEQISILYTLNQKMSEEAQNLTKALKGDTKAQGNWGEFILESILEKSGLVKGREYILQASYTDAEGRRFQPDVVINLPDNKSLIIDSKVSLVAYDKFISADDESTKNNAVKEHLQSIRQHIKGLGDKNYQQLYDLKTLDFVLLFIPVEPAFALAVQNDSNLFNDAFDKNIVIVSPSTLLATLRTVASIWRQENQNRNAIEIARKAGDLYDKFTGFAEDMIDLGKKLDSGKKAYVDAMNKLVEGKGNLVRRAEELKTMGAKASKNLPQNLIDRATDDV